MTLLLNYSTSWCQRSNEDYVISSTGESIIEEQDSVLIAYSDLRIANSKMIELKYEKELNNNYRILHSIDSVTINYLTLRYNNMEQTYNRNIKSIKKNRNILGGTTVISIILLVLSLL